MAFNVVGVFVGQLALGLGGRDEVNARRAGRNAGWDGEDGEDEARQGQCPGVGDGGGELVIAGAGGVGGRHVAEDKVGAVEQGLKFGVELAVADFRHGHAAGEDGEPGEEGLRQILAGVEQAHGLEQVGDEGVNLVVGAGGVSGKLKHADVGVPDIEGDGADALEDAEHDVA